MSPARASAPRCSPPCCKGRSPALTLGVDPVKVFSHLNRFLCTRDAVGRYATMFFGLISPDGMLEFVRASHPSPLLLRQGQVSELCTGGSFPVGLIEQATFESERIQLQPQDTLGSTPTASLKLKIVKRSNSAMSCSKQSSPAIRVPPSATSRMESLAHLEKFTAGVAQSDDITLLVVRYTGAGELTAATATRTA